MVRSARRGLPRAVLACAAFLMLAVSTLVPAAPVGAAPISSQFWAKKSSTTSPPARSGAAMAFTSYQTLLFGGTAADGTYLNDTWVYNSPGNTWVQQSPSLSPSARTGATLGYNIATGQPLLFGGQTAPGVYTNEMWTWNGSSWTKLVPNGIAPTPRAGAMMTYDPTSNTEIVFGGQTGASTYIGDTFSFSAQGWTRLTPTPSPAARAYASFTFDQATGTSLLFGGTNGAVRGDNWVFANGNWTALSPATSPGARSNHQTVFDPDSGQIVLFGGASATGPLRDFWAWDGSTWTRQPNVTGPAARADANLVWDPSSGQVLLFGGTSNGNVNAETWVLRPPAGPYVWQNMSPTTSPPARSGATTAYDPVTTQFLMFGGRTASGPQNDTWIWSGSDWTQLSPANSPPPRVNAVMAFDNATNQLILFGGLDGSGNPLGDTWLWTGSTWTQLTPATAPSPRSGAAMDFDVVDKVLVMFGGFTDAAQTAANNETWWWTGTTWTQYATSPSPPARGFATLIYDGGANHVYVIGGDPGDGGAPLNDVWTMGYRTWVAANPLATARKNAAAAWVPHLKGIAVTGGTNSSGTTLSDTRIVRFSDSAVATSGSLPARSQASATFDPRYGQFVLFGGLDASGAPTSTTVVLDVQSTAPTLTTTSSQTSSTTLNGYDQHLANAQTITMAAPVGADWNVSMSADRLPTSNGSTLAAPTVNGSSSAYTSTANPTVTCAVAGCTVPTQTGSVVYPVAVQTATALNGASVVFAAKINTGSGQLSIPLSVWANIPATAGPGTYTSTLTVATNFGP